MVVFIAIAAPIVLAIMGAIIAFWSPTAWYWRVAWLIAFAAVACGAIGAGVVDRKQSAQEALGGDGFCDLTIPWGPGVVSPTGIFTLRVSNLDDHPLYDVTITVFEIATWYDRKTISYGVLPPNQLFRETEFTVKAPGVYIIFISTRATPNGFTERLTLSGKDKDGRVHQSYELWRVGANDKVLMRVNN